MQVVIATRNEGKIKEIKEIMTLNGVEFLTFHDFQTWLEVEEKGSTFKENAILKAQALVDFTGLPTLADDSGLTVDVLGGEPGILSARYAGLHCSTTDNNAKLLKKLQGTPFQDRAARFRCVAAFADTKGEIIVAEEVCCGYIAFEPRGSGGFGYDPLFMPEGYTKTVAELSAQEKNRISHRGKAFRVLRGKLEKWVQEG